MPRKRRSSSAGSQHEDGIAERIVHNNGLDSIHDDYDDTTHRTSSTTTPRVTEVDVDATKRLLGSLLYLKDPVGRSFLHTQFQLSWAKALLDRAKSLDEWLPENNDKSNNKQQSSSTTRSLQRRFLLQPDEESGYTPLHRAMVEGNLAAVLLFLRHAMDTTSTGRFTQRPMQVLLTASSPTPAALESCPTTASGGDSSSSDNNNSLSQLMAEAVDKEGLTPLRLLGRLQRSELQKCRAALEECQPQVDQRATTRLRPRQNSFHNNEQEDEAREGVDFFSENGDLLNDNDNDDADGCTIFAKGESVTYACEVMTFGRPQHYALGVVPGISSSSNLKDKTSQFSRASLFTTHRVQEFAQETVGRDGAAIAVAAASHHTMIVTKNGHLYACGHGKGGRLGLGQEQTQHCPLPRRVTGPLQRRCVVNVAAAENHTLCVTKEGIVFSWGSNRFGQLGDSSLSVSAGSRSVPRRVDELKQYPCVSVAAGERHSVALSRKGEVFVWGDNTCGQLGVPRRSGIQKVQRVEALWKASSAPKVAVAIAAADQSTLVLTAAPNDGSTYVNSVYEWGHGNHVPIKVHFEIGRYKSMSGKDLGTATGVERVINPVAIAGGKFHNAAITSDGLVYTWGLHADSLGRNTNSNSTKQQQRRNSLPQLVTELLTENGGGRAVAIAASDQRTAVVCDNGALFTWGTTDGKNIQGHQGIRWQHLPRQVPGVHRAVSVAVAKEHTVLLIGAGFPSVPTGQACLSLDTIAARIAAKHVDLFNVIPILIMAERTQCNFLVKYCSSFIRRNFDGVLNSGKKSVMNQYLNDMLASTTHLSGKRFRDDRHHPFIFDMIQAGNELSPSFNRDWLSSFEKWTRSCSEIARCSLVQRLVAIADEIEQHEERSFFSGKVRRSSSVGSDAEVRKVRARSLSCGSELHEASTSNPQGRLDSCIKRTANMDLSTTQSVSDNSHWLSKEIRGVRKKLKQISHLLNSQATSVVLTAEQQAKVDRRLVLEAELSVYESAMEEVKRKIRELSENDAGSNALLNTPPAKNHDDTTPQVSFAKNTEKETKLISDGPTSEHGDSVEGKVDILYVCDLCGVKCSDKSNLLLHQNGRKHRNREAQVAEEEKKRAAASILEQKQLDDMKTPSTHLSRVQPSQKNAWGLSSTPPKYKLPPPPHPVVSQVTPLTPKSPKWAVTNTAGRGSIKASSPISNFEQMLKKSRASPKTAIPVIESPAALGWDSSPGSSRCVPLSLYSVAEPMETKNRGNVSLGDFLPHSDRKNPQSSTPAAAPWLSPGPAASPSLKSLMTIQAEEANLKSREDKASGSVGGRWYVERRERASSLLEIQSGARQEEEERLLIEEQLRIEAQIMEENRKIQDEKEKGGKPSTRRRPNNKQKKKTVAKENSNDGSQGDISKSKKHPRKS